VADASIADLVDASTPDGIPQSGVQPALAHQLAGILESMQVTDC
jgi:hypothetical protein